VTTITSDIANPSRVAFDATGEFLYVANAGPSGSNGWITVYDTANNNAEVTADKISTGSISRPLGVAVDANGSVYVADNARNAISVYQPNPSGGFVEASFSPLSGDAAGGQFFAPGALLFYSLSGIGDFLVVGTGGGNVFAYSAPLTNTSTPLFALSRVTCPNAPAGPTGFATFGGIFGGPPSSFFISDYYGGDVLDYDISSFFSGSACGTIISQTPSGSNNGPEGVAVDIYGNVFVTNAGANSLAVYAKGALGATATFMVQ
jgi:streptogramin lyase